MRYMFARVAALCAIVSVPAALAAQATSVRDAAGHERQCQPADYPKTIPPVAAVVDSAALAAQLATLAPPSDSSTYLISLLFTDNGALNSAHLVEATDVRPDLVDAVRAAVRHQTFDSPWAIRLRVRRGAASTLSLERSVYCAPQPVRGTRPPSRITVLMNPTDGPPPDFKLHFEAEVKLSETGDVIRVDPLRRSGIRDVDDQYMNNIRTDQYLPALIDGLAIPSWYRTTGQRLRM